ncbi:MAG: PrsW family intramembrane metalloprotease [Polyangiaceae bacterium]|nr:PrsW family intramembrane metalloprotease [Polyangiaceae bacterium]
MIATLRWIGPSLVTALLLASVVYLSDRRREPWPLIVLTFVLGGVGKAMTTYIEVRAQAWAGLDVTVTGVESTSSLLFVFGLVAPLREASKVCAMWPAFRSKYFDEPLDGVVYSSSTALGFACIENALVLREHTVGWVWIARTAIALPAHVFFAAAWGYALGRVKHDRRPKAIFRMAWFFATVAHGLYIHLVYGRGPGALVGTIPLLGAMAVATFFALRDLSSRTDRSSRTSILLERVSALEGSGPPSLRSVRAAMRREGEPITVRWILYGALVTLGAMTFGLALSIGIGHYAHIDFSVVDEHDVTTTAPVLLLGAGLLTAFPVSGYLVARASNLPTLLEPALASGLALVATLALVGLAAPVVLVFGFAFSPIAWGLACAGAWIGRSS